MVDWFIHEYVGGPQCIGNPNIDGWFADDVYGLGSPGYECIMIVALCSSTTRVSEVDQLC